MLLSHTTPDIKRKFVYDEYPLSYNIAVLSANDLSNSSSMEVFNPTLFAKTLDTASAEHLLKELLCGISESQNVRESQL